MTPDRDECIEQAYFFRLFRERLGENVSAQDVLERADEEVLTTTRLPFAIQFLRTEMRHSGLLGNGFAKLPHYFTPFQTFVVRMAEQEKVRFTIQTALVVLEREAKYKADGPTPAGLFVFHYEVIARNRLGYDAGVAASAGDPLFDADWKAYLDLVRRQAGSIDFADLIYVRSEWYAAEQRRSDPGYVPPVRPLFAEKEGKIAKASRGRDPLFLFAGLQRQLGYPEVPRPRAGVNLAAVVETLAAKVKELETRLRMVESETRGTFDPTQFGKPDGFRNLPDFPDE